MKRFLEPLSAMHEGEHVYRGRYGAKEGDQQQYPKAEHPVIRTHPVSGRKALFVNRGFTRASFSSRRQKRGGARAARPPRGGARVAAR